MVTVPMVVGCESALVCRDWELSALGDEPST
jgi:hypothetical protein